MLCVPHHRLLLAALLTDLIGAVPFTLDGPRSEALMIGIVASSMAVLDEATTSMAAVKVADKDSRECGTSVRQWTHTTPLFNTHPNLLTSTHDQFASQSHILLIYG